MFDSIATIMTEVYRAYGNPAREYLDPSDIASATWEVFARYGLIAQQSEYERATRSVFLPLNSRDSRITQAQDIMAPSFLERRIGLSPNESWDWIPTVGLEDIEDQRDYGREAACTFYRDENRQFRLRLSYDPISITHRLWYFSNPGVPNSPGEPLPLPARFGFMFMHKAIVNTAPKYLARAANLPIDKQLNSGQLGAISSVVGHSQGELQSWEKLWKKEIDSDRSPGGRNRRSLIGRRQN